ncbi:EGF-like domain protein, partial [Trichinella nativa]
MIQSVASDFIKDEEGYIEIPPVQFRKEAYFDLRSGHGATISCQSIKEELLPFVKSEENWQTQTHWYKKNYSNWQLVTVPSDMPQILQNLRFYGEDIEIASLLAGVHNGDYLCIVSIVNKSIAVAMNIRLDVFDCKQHFTVSHGYCFHGLCSLLDKNFKHSRMHCDCQPGYSGLYCAEKTIFEYRIDSFGTQLAAGAAASAAALAPPVATAGPLGTLDNFVAP